MSETSLAAFGAGISFLVLAGCYLLMRARMFVEARVERDDERRHRAAHAAGPVRVRPRVRPVTRPPALGVVSPPWADSSDGSAGGHGRHIS